LGDRLAWEKYEGSEGVSVAAEYRISVVEKLLSFSRAEIEITSLSIESRAWRAEISFYKPVPDQE